MANSKKKCKFCEEFIDAKEGLAIKSGFYCDMDHAIKFGQAQAQKKRERLEAKAAKEKRAENKIRLAKLDSMSKVCSDAQKHVNALTLAADRAMGLRCIATGREAEHAGHFYHAGTKYRISWLRFFHANIHGQHGESNTHQSGDYHNYRAGLINRYGEEYLSDLEEFKRAQDSGLIPAPTRDEVAGMVKWCKAMTKIYKARYARST